MNIVKRGVTEQVSLPFHHSSRKWRFLLYSTSSSALNPPKPRTRSQKPKEPQPQPSSSLISHWPRPSEIPYQAKVANLVNIIGHIRIPVKFQTSPAGKYLAGTVIYQDNGQERPCLLPLLFEGDLAHVVTFHVKENDCVYVSGQLIEDRMPFIVGETPARLHLRVQNINFVEDFDKIAFKQRSRQNFGGYLLSESSDVVNGDSMSKLGVGESIVSANRRNSKTSLRSAENLDSWRDLVQNSGQWRDYRKQKSKGLVKDKRPDFKHRDTGTALWLGDAPNWVLERLQSLDFDVPPKQKQGKDAKEELWRSLVENPNQWWDNRLDKKNPKSSDFKHKARGEGLWLNSLPDWVLSKLPPTGRERQNFEGGKKCD